MTLVKMAAGNKIGVNVNVEGDILSPMFGSLVIELPAGQDVDKLMAGAVYAALGKTTVDGRLTVNGPVSYTHLDVYKRQHIMQLLLKSF